MSHFRYCYSGKNRKGSKGNMKDLIKEYLSDPDTPKPCLKEITPSSLTYISVQIPAKLL
jgi:hypothetical protein